MTCHELMAAVSALGFLGYAQYHSPPVAALNLTLSAIAKDVPPLKIFCITPKTEENGECHGALPPEAAALAAAPADMAGNRIGEYVFNPVTGDIRFFTPQNKVYLPCILQVKTLTEEDFQKDVPLPVAKEAEDLLPLLLASYLYLDEEKALSDEYRRRYETERERMGQRAGKLPFSYGKVHEKRGWR